MKILNLITSYMGVGVVLFGFLGASVPEFFSHLKWATPYLLGFVMFGMGLSLKFQDFYNIFSKPFKVLLGITLQFVLMPILAYVLVKIISLPIEFAIGVILVGCSPGGTASNVLCYLAKGDVALSVSVTVCTTLLSPVITPALFYLLAHNTISFDYLAIMLDIFKMVIAPVFLGVCINAFCAVFAKRLGYFMPSVSSVTIMIIVGIVVSLSSDKLQASSVVLFFIVCVHNLMGIILAYVICRLFKADSITARTLAIETGTQNSGLAAVLAITHFGAGFAVAASIFSIMQNVIGSFFANLFLTKKEKMKIKHKALV